ncbi:MAG: exodeoxyribonuclease VII large subunit [Rhodobacteraceae bacterium]|nr:MAG: exodeoxyribonuclease VII large subunit [Paracoccaceae bacterium]
MSDLIDNPEPGQNAPEFSVSEISGAVKRMIEGEFSHVRIRGEIGRVKKYSSGHIYYDLKDAGAVLNAVTWKGQASKLTVQPEEGMEVIAVGKLTSYPMQSKYQMNVTQLRVAGVGALMAMLEKRKKALAAEGLFDQDRKQPIPYLPEVIGVVTSPSGAVIRDILHRLRDRFPRKVIIWPVAVQGDGCAPQVTAAIEGFNALTPGGAVPRPDLIIVARGGGSIEDLWGFNEESVVRAAAASVIPLISAVGHETDTTLIDYASDHRAPTPTAAAERAVPVRAELVAWLAGMEQRRVRALVSGIERRQQRLKDVSRALPNLQDIVAMKAQRLDMVSARLPRALQAMVQNKRVGLVKASSALRPISLRQNIEQKQRVLEGVSSQFQTAAMRQVERLRDRLTALDRLRETLGYKATLERGYAVVRDGSGKVVSDLKTAKSSDALEIEFKDGLIKTGAGTLSKTARSKPKTAPKDQGNLF